MIGNKGFTLIEVLIVIVIMGILMAVAAPELLELSRNAKFKEAAQLASSTLRRARGQAINLNQNVNVSFTLDDTAANDNNSVTIGTESFKFKSGIEIKRGADCDNNSGTVSITFNPGGGSNTSYLCIFDGATRKYRIGVANPTMGRVLLQKWQGSDWK